MLKQLLSKLFDGTLVMLANTVEGTRLKSDVWLITQLIMLTSCLAVTAATVAGAQNISTTPHDPQPTPNFLVDIFSFRLNYRPQVDLNGVWEFKIDKDGAGRTQGWQEGKGTFDRTIDIPGVPQAQGIGTPNSRQKHQFFEPYWVRRRFVMPPVDSGKRIWLRLGGVFPAADVYLNGRHVGYTKSSRTQQRVDVTEFIKLDAENWIAIEVCDLPRVRLDGMYEWQELSMIWSGVYRPVRLEVADPVSIVDAYIRPQLGQSKADVSFTLSQPSSVPLTVVWRAMDGTRAIGTAEVKVPAAATQGTAEVKLDHFTWPC